MPEVVVLFPGLAVLDRKYTLIAGEGKYLVMSRAIAAVLTREQLEKFLQGDESQRRRILEENKVSL